MPTPAKLILLPNVLNDEERDIQSYFTKAVIDLVPTLDGLIAESEKEGRYYLKRFTFPEGRTFRDIPIKVLSEHTKEGDYAELLSLIKPEQKWGVISDAGLPCLADPGARLVFLARQRGIHVQAHMGPSSIILALMLSGLMAQKFTFEGYLPKEMAELTVSIKQIQLRSVKEGSTHLFIETPYRSQQMLERLVELLDGNMVLSICCDLTLPTQLVMTYTIAQWRKMPMPDIQKRPVVFVVAGAPRAS
ncbi:MAG: 16S rRNA methyltransferase [Chlamydiia bacterium]|jgi:16S rRNA (cytidine1402-2'-O)-methyltransferase|nr:16S rRNA methyltransferase [Chlamydiia bacterium]